MSISLVCRELANAYHFTIEPGLYVLACQRRLSTSVADQAARLKLSGSYPAKHVLPPGLIRPQARFLIRLEIAAYLQGKGLAALTGKVALIGSGNYELMSADGGHLALRSSETDIVSFRLGAVEYPLAKPLRVTLSR